jgi:hypothetical protein
LEVFHAGQSQSAGGDRNHETLMNRAVVSIRQQIPGSALKPSHRQHESFGAVFPVAAVGVIGLTCLLSICPGSAWADEMCGPSELKHVEGVAARLQPYASKVTKTGSFVVKAEYPGNATESIAVSFMDHGKPIFVHRITGIAATMPTEFRPGKTKSGDPGMLVVLSQGNIGECQYAMLLRGGKFVVMPRGYKQYKR